MRFNEFLKSACPPLDLEWRKYRRSDARHRVETRMAELGLADYAAYLKRLQHDPIEAAGLAERMRITVSRFFREAERWEILRQTVLPELLRIKRPDAPLRIWSAGCCGGEEPYTLALLWLESFQEHYPDTRLVIIASDIDAASLERAQRGVYAHGSVREIPKPTLKTYFERDHQNWQLQERVKRLVRFNQIDLMHDPLPTALDLVFCRYLVFTYYRGRRRLAAARRLWQALRPGGALMIARKEALESAAELFTPWPDADGVFRKQG
jgi:chemotaxis methyl-accepting protein methylase